MFVLVCNLNVERMKNKYDRRKRGYIDVYILYIVHMQCKHLLRSMFVEEREREREHTRTEAAH